MNKYVFYYSVKYLIKKISNPNFQVVIKTVERINSNTNKNKWYILIDILWCRIIHFTDIFEYEVFKMYNLNFKQRKTIFTTIHKWAYAKKFNNSKYKYIFNYKDEFYKEYSEFIGRNWLKIDKNSKRQLANFITNKKVIIAKKAFGGGGKQIYKIDLVNYKTIDDLLNCLLNNNVDIVEDLIVQHPKISELYPNSVNTIRLVTFFINDKTNIVVAYLRIGRDKYVDNISSGGILVPIDIEEGVTNAVGEDYSNNIFEFHPVTNKSLVGVEIPMWKESINLVKKAAIKFKEVGIIGWDIAITKNGPIIIEGNYYPSSTLYQLPAHIPNKIGKLPVFKKIANR